jgi:hypothetical protein
MGKHSALAMAVVAFSSLWSQLQMTPKVGAKMTSQMKSLA